MSEYIDRECFIEDIKTEISNLYMDGIKGTPRPYEELWGFIDRINEQPASDVTPVRHGRWDNIPNSYVSVCSKDGSYSGNTTTCSVCHEVNPNAYKTNYCPNCGAEMEE